MKKKDKQILLLIGWTIFTVVINLIITLCIMSSVKIDSDTNDIIAKKTEESNVSDNSNDAILSNLGLSKTKDYKEYNHDAYDYDYLASWTLADGSIIDSRYQLDPRIDFGPSKTLGIDKDLNSYIYVYDEETDKLIYESGKHDFRDTFKCEEYYTDRGLDGGVVYIVAYQTKSDEVFRKDTFMNIKIGNFTE